MHGWMNGPDGQHMSKSKGNYIEPMDVVAKHGVDALRLYLLKVNAPWEDISFQWEEVKNAQRTLNILWNVYKFAATYMAMDRFDPHAVSIDEVAATLRAEDRWLLSRIERLKAGVKTEFEGYNLHRAARLLEDFVVEDLSRWYVKLIRDRSWDAGDDPAKRASYTVLHEALLTAAKLLSPFCPHLAEELYQNLDGRLLSIHMTDWPTVTPRWMDDSLEKGMTAVQGLVQHLSRLRQKQQVKLRWPIREVSLKGAPDDLSRALRTLEEVFRQQANVKHIVVLGPDEEFPGLEMTLKPNVEAISHIYKLWWTRIISMLGTRNAAEVKRALEEKKEYRLGISGQVIKIEPHMVDFETNIPEDVQVEQGPFGELYVDMRQTDEVRSEGFAREVVRRVQQMRKDLNLVVEDYIRTSVKTNARIIGLLEEWNEFIGRETRSRPLTIAQLEIDEEYAVEWPIEGETVLIGITPLQMGEAIRDFTSIPGITEEQGIALFGAGFPNLSSIRLAEAGSLSSVEGLDAAAVEHIRAYLEATATPTPDCPVCGSPLQTPTGRCLRCRQFPNAKQCPKCGVGLYQNQTVCDECGEQLEPMAEGVMDIPPPPPAPPAPEPKPVPAVTVPPMQEARAPEVEPAPEPEELPAQAEVPAAQPEGAAEAPAAAAPAEEHLRESSIYVFLEDGKAHGWEAFLKEVEAGRKGLCVTRTYPAKVREKHPILAETPFLWLSNVGEREAVRPKDIEKLSLELERFIAHEGGVVLLDGLEYLITNNNFITVLRLVQSLRDQAAISRATLILPVSASTLGANELGLIKREADIVLDG
jgi:predicted RNA-binding Zn-ribbon protein involved in translation (DUF1610 family)